MCLTTTETIAIKIDEDIRSYKVLIERDGELISPFQSFKYELGKEYKSELEEYTTSVNHGFHTNKYFGMHPADIQTMKNHLNRESYMRKGDKLVIARCTIPKGSKVLYGTWEEFLNREHYTGFASDKLIIEKVIKDLA